MRKIMGIIKKIKNLYSPKMKDGSSPKAKLMLYGFFGHNLGDDIFFDMLLKRYPDTMFYVLFTADYEPTFAKYNNVRYYPNTRPLVQKIDRLGAKLKKDMLFEKILLKKCDGAVHIGGSIYQQIGDWENDLRVRKSRHRNAKRFFGISNNFGPYFTEGYKEFWENEFGRFDGVSFRDKYSYGLFSHINGVSYAPDLLFGLQKPDVAEDEKSVAVSVINPRFEFRKIEKNIADNYINKLTETINILSKKGYSVKLLGFCNLEDDTSCINEIYENLDPEVKSAVSLHPYTADFSETVRLIASSRYVIATRFHASVIGYAFSKKVLPVSYNIKVKNMLSDLGIDDYIDFEKMGEASPDELVDDLLNRQIPDIKDVRSSSLTHFHALDEFIKSKKGRIADDHSLN